MSDPMMQVIAGAAETQNSPAYRWNNASRHNAHVIVQYTVEGRCFFREGNKVTDVREGQAFVAIPPEDTEYGYPPEASAPYRLEWLNFAGQPAIELAMLVRRRHGPVVSMGRNSEALLLFRRILQLFQSAEFQDRYQECALIQALMMAVLREQALKAQEQDPVVFCYNYLQDHHRSPFNIKNLAADAGISREHLTREFARRYGQTPAAMLRSLRLRTAMNQLLSSRQSVEEIARSSGLSNSRTLSRMFTEATGKAPEQFRREKFGK